MRKISKTEQEKEEIAESERRETRKGGYSLMSVRDRGWVRLSNGAAMEWQVDEDKRVEGQVYTTIPDNHFLLIIDGKKALFDAEEFRRYLRWV